MNKKDLMKLKIVPEEIGYSLWLDDKKIHHVEDYRIEKSSLPGTATVMLKILVRYP